MIIWDISYQDAVQLIEEKYTDNTGLPIQGGYGDRGDTANRIGLIYTLRFLNEGMSQDLKDKFDNALNQIEIESSVYIRHPNGNTYPNGLPCQDYVTDPKQFSRDQEEPVKIALGFYSEQEPRLQRLYEKRLSNRMIYQNGDIPGPANEGVYMRSFGNKLYYPLLMVSDLDLLINASIRLVARKINPLDTTNDLVLSLMFLQAERKTGTIVSWLAKQVYKLSKPMQALDSYFNKESNAPPYNILFKKPMEEAGF